MTETHTKGDYVLLIDDNADQLDPLETATKAALEGSGLTVRTWSPAAEDDASEKFKELTKDVPLLVVTDYDLTRNGRTGLFGFSIVAMAQRDAIPVADYSREIGALTEDPDVFEFRLPSIPADAAPIIAGVAKGFREIRDGLRANPQFLSDGSPATVLASLLGEGDASSAFSLYSSRLTSGNAALVQILRHPHGDHADLRVRVSTYVIGHLLFNSILRYPGPIMERHALHAYVTASPDQDADLDSLFKECRYEGPFSELADYYWQSKVDEEINRLAITNGVEFADENFDEFRRRVVERALARDVQRHGCERCDGSRGGYWCPFTKRPVCDEPDCSIPTSSWVPEGAYLTRIENDFYEEWATLVGQ